MNFYLTFKLSVSILFLIFAANANVYAEFSKEDYLWLQFDSKISNADHSVTQPFFIFYGQFPDKKKTTEDLGEVAAFYTFGEKDKSGKDMFYRLNVEKKEGHPYIKINSARDNWCMLLVKYKKEIGGIKYDYLAKATFFILPGAGYIESRGIPVEIKDAGSGLDIRIYRERIKEAHTYDRIRGYPIRSTLLFNDIALSNQDADIIDNSGKSERLRSDKRGNIVYNIYKNKYPSENEWQNRPFEQDLIVTSYASGSVIYKSSYVIIFVPEFIQKSNFSHNLRLGFSIFSASALISLFSILAVRKNIKHESV